MSSGDQTDPATACRSANVYSSVELKLIPEPMGTGGGPCGPSRDTRNASRKIGDGYHDGQDAGRVEEALTSVNSHLTRSTTGPTNPSLTTFAINCTPDLTASVSGYVAESLAPATRSGYLSDLTCFRGWGGSIPAREAVVASYIASHADTHAAATLARWLASISKAHRASGTTDPTKSELVKATFRGIRRTHGVAQDQATALLREDLFMVLDDIDDDLRAARDRALLLLGFAGGFRRSELVGLDVDDIEHVRQGIVAVITRALQHHLRLHAMLLLAGLALYLLVMALLLPWGIGFVSQASMIVDPALATLLVLAVCFEILWTGALTPIAAHNAHPRIAIAFAPVALAALLAAAQHASAVTFATGIAAAHAVMLAVTGIAFARLLCDVQKGSVRQ